MVKACEKLWDWSFSCDVSNLQTMTIEIIIASVLDGIAIAAAVGFYFKEKSDRVESETIIKKQGKMLERIEPLIQKQEEHAKLLENQTLLSISAYLVIIEQRLEKMDKLYPELRPDNIIENKKIKKDIEGYRQNIHNLIKDVNGFSRENIRDKTLAYDLNAIIRDIQGYCEIQIFADNPPSKYGVDGGLIQKLSDVRSSIPHDIMDAIPKERLA